jgi:hypothetical protein
MARVTVEDCLAKIPNRFALVIIFISSFLSRIKPVNSIFRFEESFFIYSLYFELIF